MLTSLHLVMNDAALRQQAISSNLANVNTPGYQRTDVSASFESSLTDALNRLSQGDSVSSISMPEGTLETAAVQGPARPDGNTVQIEQEMLGLAQNSAKYEFASNMMSLNYHGIQYAITGKQ